MWYDVQVIEFLGVFAVWLVLTVWSNRTVKESAIVFNKNQVAVSVKVSLDPTQRDAVNALMRDGWSKKAAVSALVAARWRGYPAVAEMVLNAWKTTPGWHE